MSNDYSPPKQRFWGAEMRFSLFSGNFRSRRHGSRRASNDTLLAQPLHLVSTDAADLTEQRLAVLAEQWRAAHRDRGVRQFDRAADGLIGAAGRIVDIDDHLARLQMRVGQDLAGVLAGAARDAGLPEDAHDLVLRPGAGPL